MKTIQSVAFATALCILSYADPLTSGCKWNVGDPAPQGCEWKQKQVRKHHHIKRTTELVCEPGALEAAQKNCERQKARELLQSELEQLKTAHQEMQSKLAETGQALKAEQDEKFFLQMDLATKDDELGRTKMHLESCREDACEETMTMHAKAVLYTKNKINLSLRHLLGGVDIQDKDIEAFVATACAFSPDLCVSLEKLKTLRDDISEFDQEAERFEKLFWDVLTKHNELEALLGPQAVGLVSYQ